MQNIVSLVEYQETHYSSLTYQLSEEQANFTATIHYCINERGDQQDIDKTVVTILYDDVPVGFFVLDSGNDKSALTDNPQALLIRSLSVNSAYQGQGIGIQAMQQLSSFVRQRLPQVNELVLSVNKRNKTAYHVYLKAGYSDDGKVINGPMGDQYVLTKSIE